MADISIKGSSGSSVYSSDLTATHDKVRYGKTYVGADTNDEAGVGTIPDYTGGNIVPSFSGDTTIASGQYLTGNVTIYGVTVTNLTAGNLKKGITGKVGDSASDTRLANVVGTYTTVTGGKSAITSGSVRNNFRGFANGSNEIVGKIPDQAAQTITPGTSDKTIPSGKYTTGAQVVKGDANLIPANIRAGVSIFGVVGTKQPENEGLTTSITFPSAGTLYISSTGNIRYMWGSTS